MNCAFGFMAAMCLSVAVVEAHPSGLAGGRTSCGREFNTPKDAYNIVAVDEAWYLRRIQTCDTPFFWSKWQVTKVRMGGTIPTGCVHGWSDSLWGGVEGVGVSMRSRESLRIFPLLLFRKIYTNFCDGV